MSGADDADIMDERLWRKSGWVARVIKNEDDDGWAVEMTRVGDSEPAARVAAQAGDAALGGWQTGWRLCRLPPLLVQAVETERRRGARAS